MLNVATCQDPEYPLREVTRDATAYYLREGESPGRWWGAGATALGLAGEVGPKALRDLFDGKDPDTGAYLTPARGSSARANARREEADLDLATAAARLAMSPNQVRARLRSGALAGEKTARGRWRVPAAAVAAYKERADQPSAAGPLPPPGPDGAYSLPEAARLAGVHPSYFKRIAVTEAPAVATREDGRAVQYLLGRRDERDRWRIAPAELARYRAARAAPSPVPAYDLALRAPKSVSLLHALAHLIPARHLEAAGLPANVAAEVVAAHHAAVDDALGLLQRRAAFVRGPGGRVEASGLTVALFDHRSSRAGDPLLHSHAVVLNVATGIDGRRAALDGTALYAWAQAAGHVYQARLRAELVARLGVRFHQPHHGVADLVGVGRDVVETFSERRRQLRAAMERLGTTGARAAQSATLATRPPKHDAAHQSPQQLAARAAEVGFGAPELAALVGHGPEPPLAPEALARIAAQLAGPEGLCARATRVDVRDAIRGFATELAGGARGTELERWATTLLHDGHRFVPVLASPTRAADTIRRADGRRVRAGGVGPTYATPELLAHEAALLDAHDRGLRRPHEDGVGLGVVSGENLEAALAEHPTLSGEQAAMVRHLTTSGVGLEVVVGGPGTGKTFALGAAATAWRAAGCRVVGAALQGGAAEVLAREARLDEQHTLTALLGRCDRQGPEALGGAVVVVDEAGMADTRQLARLARYAAAADAKVVVVGDPDQIPEVGAGGAFGHLVGTLGDAVIALRDNRRQRHGSDRARLALIRRGRAEEAIASAAADGRWHTAPSGDELRERLLRDWHDDPAPPGSGKLMVATTVAEVEWLNRGARVLLAAEGRLGPDALRIPLAAPDRAVEERELRVGDVVRATRNDWSAAVFTGSVGRITALDPAATTATVAFEAGRGASREVRLGAEFLHERPLRTPGGRWRTQAPGLAHAYASTAHAVQGRTAERAYVLVARAGLHRQAAYVAASRAADETLLYGLTVPDPPEVDRLDRGRGQAVADPDDATELAEAMARDASQTMASAADPDAAAVGELLRRPAAWLWRERAELASRCGGRPPLVESLRQVRTALADAYGLDLAALECRPLREAMTRALEVPGATPERLTALMLRRDRRFTRELDSAEDPIAVLVWAAGTRATEVLATEAAKRRLPGSAEQRERLRLLDAAIVRQRDARLGLAEHDDAGWATALLGPLPHTAAGRAAWRRAAGAVVDYRDGAGIFDADRSGTDPWVRALGPVPTEGRAHHDQARAAVAEARAAIVVADLRRFVPPAAGPRPPAVEALADRSLGDLEAELATLQRAGAEGRRRRGRVVAATRALHDAEQELAGVSAARSDAGGRSRRRPRRGRSRHAPALAAAVVARERAEQRVQVARERLEAAEEAVRDLPAPDERAALVRQAIGVRERRLRRSVLVDPPPWVRDDVATATTATQPRDWDVGRLAASYGELAVDADRRGLGDATTVDELRRGQPEPDRGPRRPPVRTPLPRRPPPEPEALDLSL